MPSESAILFHVGSTDVKPGDIVALADGRYRAILDPSEEFESRIERGAEAVQKLAEAGAPGGMATLMTAGDAESTANPDATPIDFLRAHGAGVGEVLSDREVAAIVASRLISLARGFSGVRLGLLNLLCDMLNLRVLPRVPRSGAGGVNADAVPLSYLAAAMSGEREVSYLGRLVLASEGLRAARLRPLVLRPKEAIALMSGTGVAVGLGCVAWDRARRFARFATALLAVATDVTRAGIGHLDPRVDGLKPHPGTRTAANWLREDLDYESRRDQGGTSAPELLRAAPHFVGTLLAANQIVDDTLAIELTSVSDDPIVHPATGELLRGGNFYGGQVALALDGLKEASASVTVYLERVLSLTCNPATNGGLPAELASTAAPTQHGFRAMRLACAGLTAEATRLAVPAALFARAASSDPYEVSSMGTQAALDCLALLEHAETVAAIVALGMCQAVDLRDGVGCHRRSKVLYGAVRQLVPRLEADRAQDRDIKSVLELFRAGLLPTGI